MDDLDKRILTAIQSDLPVTERPFDAVAARLDVGADEVLDRVRRLLADGAIRRLGPVFDSRSLGYVSTLVAAKVPPGRLDEVADAVNRLPGVTHNYERRGAYNLWFTLTEPSQDALDGRLARLRAQTGIADIHSLPALTVYKIRVHFDLTDDEPERGERGGCGGRPRSRSRGPAQPPPLTDEQKEFVRLIQDGLPPEHEPFTEMAERLGWPVKRVVEQVCEWLDGGVIRRFGAVVEHRGLGYRAGGMAVFRAGPKEVDAAGASLAEHPEVSHCYRRPPLPDFPYTLFAMTHGRSEGEVRRTVAHMAADAGLGDYDVLFSVREFKKASMRYFMEDGAR
ncbi:MAG: hypothetical protein AMS14_09515 [Planctomycetes bacterium DG_20]|nr:MAG: hypothetical protein AMS14_09515 [Planctomycetes bacterium DG_20]